MKNFEITKDAFGENFKWGVSISAYQTEGAVDQDGKGESIWDRFSHKKGKIKTGENADSACNFYHNYKEYLDLAKDMNFEHFGFSLAWSRIMPNGKGALNQKGIDYYHKVIDYLLTLDIEPWITLYHWDLPQKLEDEGGWSNREIIGWFSDYVDLCTRIYGDKVKNYKILNEPSAFTGFGYMTGEHAPGNKNLFGFLSAAHHANLCQAEGGRIAKSNVKNGNIGTSFASFEVQPIDDSVRNVYAARRIDVVVQRMFIEPLVGLGYPYKDFQALKMIDMFFKDGDDKKIQHNFDFIGVQYYCRLVGKFNWFPPLAFANEVPAKLRGVPHNNMGFEIYPEGMYNVLKRYASYPGVKTLLVTENGVCLDDQEKNGRVDDKERILFYKDYLTHLLKAKQEGINVEGFFCWSLMDNFEWWEGFKARFGLIYLDHKTQKKTIKDSGYWIKNFLSSLDAIETPYEIVNEKSTK